MRGLMVQSGTLPNQRLKKGITASLAPDGRIYYFNHVNQTTSWLPPIDSWDAGDPCLPYGWEIACDAEGKNYYINHLNKTTTYEDPRKDDDDPPPQPREVELFRHPEWGFGFVAGSEKPVIVRSVKEGGPSDDKLLPGDQILKINGIDMIRAPREEVIEMVKSCQHSVKLTVCQPFSTRKSAILTAAKKAKLKSNPSRVRFAEGVAINGSPLYCQTPFESAVPFMPNVLKVFLENGQTKTFKYDSSITVQDVLNSLVEKLDLRCSEYYSLCTEHIKSIRRNKLTILDPKDTLSKIAARPGAHNLRCLFRMTFVPKDTNELYEKDLNSFEYLYGQCCNDVVQERFTPELNYEIALRLCALHLYKHALVNGLVNSRGKVNLKAVEKEYGLEPFVPYTLAETMKRKQLRKYLSHSLKQNRVFIPSGQKHLTETQTKIHYLSFISEMPCYGAKLFLTNIHDSTADSALLISPKYGISHVTRGRQSSPITLAKIEDVTSIKVTKDDDLSFTVEIQLKGSGSSIETSPLHFALDEKDTEEFALVLKGYHNLLTGNTDLSKEIPVYWDVGPSWWTDSAPSYHGKHLVKPAPWSYPPSDNPNELKMVNLSLPPPSYSPNESLCSNYPKGSPMIPPETHLDHNMNNSSNSSTASRLLGESSSSLRNQISGFTRKNEILFKETTKDDINNGLSSSDDIMQRVLEMNKIIADAETYLSENEGLTNDNSDKRLIDNEEEVSESCDHHPQLKAADSLLFLTHIDDTSNCRDKIAESIDDSPFESDTDVESLITINGSLSHVQSSETTCLKNDAEKMEAFEYNHLNNNSIISKNANNNVNNSTISNHMNSNNNNNNNSNSNNSSANKVTIPIPGSSNGSSFGLHSPDVIPSLSDTENDLIETLKALQNPGEYQIPFSETTLYLDQDIIDLTAIPPPKTPDFDLSSSPSSKSSSPSSPSPYAIPYLQSTNHHYELSPSSPTPYGRLKNSARNLSNTLNNNKNNNNTILNGNSKIVNNDNGMDDNYHKDYKHNGVQDSPTNLANVQLLAEYDRMCDNLKDLQLLSNLGSSLLSSSSINYPAAPLDTEILKSLPQDIDKFIATVTVPPPTTALSANLVDEANYDNGYESNKDDCDYLSSLIIPPPPLSSPSFNQEQNDIIARFWKATDDVRKVCNDRDDSSPRLSCRGLHSSSSGDSGYDSIINSSPFFSSSSASSTLTNSTINATNHNNSNNSFHHPSQTHYQLNNSNINGDWSSTSPNCNESINYDKFFLPTVEEIPMCRSNLSNIYSRLTIDNHGSSNTTSNSSSNISTSTQSPYLDLLSLSTNNKRISESSSCDDLYCFSRKTENEFLSRSSDESADESSILRPLVKSHSWTSLQRTRNRAFGKPPLPPYSATRLSERRKLIPNCNKKLSGLTSMVEVTKSDRCSGSEFHSKLNKFPIEPSTSNLSALDHIQSDAVDNYMSLSFDNDPLSDFIGRGVLGLGVEVERYHQHESETDILLNKGKLEDLFIRSQRDIDTLLVRLEEVHENRLRSHPTIYNSCHVEKYVAAKETLLVESRHFVTASKLFVKCATEASPLLVDHLLSCISLLERMFDIGESIAIHLKSQAQITCLVDRLKEVAATFGYTVDTVHKLIDGSTQPEDASSSPYMGLLMNHAGSLATSLSALMRTLRALN
ncbi:uncharacterized protein LOC107366965 isoform X2 [Tetranychus urticae]|uniref:uncharacterized protein LOC107366965 isoform X2 n=1 Tax=Tetranychus urticae TaxID=32264 RepID=UPI00077B8ADC|nr:uncharacterized protein LOC107366965 isoform X2 [Tetranychus urticae]